MTIKEVSEKYNISQDTLRFYEKEELIFAVPRKNGKRNYGQRELDNIEFVVCMRNAGLSIEVLKKYLKLLLEGDFTINQRKELLIEERKNLKEKIDKMQQAYERLNYKIDVYYSQVLQKEKNLINGSEGK